MIESPAAPINTKQKSIQQLAVHISAPSDIILIEDLGNNDLFSFDIFCHTIITRKFNNHHMEVCLW